MTAPELSVIVLSWNTVDLTLACLDALSRDGFARSREIIVIDNASEDGSPEALAKVDGIQLVRNSENRLYAGGNNQGVALATGRYVCLLNSDTEVAPGAMEQMVSFLESHPEHGAVAPRLVDPGGPVQHACMRFPGIGVALVYDTVLAKFPPGKWIDNRYYMRDFDHLHSRDVPQPPGACFMMARQEFLDMGGFDEELFLFFNDVDLCRRLWKAGRRIHYLAEAEVAHHRGASTKKYGSFVVTWFRNRIAYYRKHYGAWTRPLMHFALRWRAFEESIRCKSRHDDPQDVKNERAHIRSMVREITSS